MKKLFFFIYFVLAVSVSAVAQQGIDQAVLKSTMKRVADWQIANPEKIKKHGELNWTNATLYVGMLDWAELAEKEDNDGSYYKWLTRIGDRNGWQMGKRMYHADDIAVGQCFADLYGKYQKEKDDNPFVGTHGMGGESSIKWFVPVGLWRWFYT